MTNIGLALTIGTLIPLCSPIDDKESVSEIDRRVKSIQDHYGIVVHTQYDREKFFPKKWRLKENPSGKQLSNDELLRSISVVESFVSQHPKEVFKTHLTDIYLLSDLSFYDGEPAGTYDGKGIYLNNNGTRHGYSREFLLGTCHAEFSSLLFQSHLFPIKEWKSANHFMFEYGASRLNLNTNENQYAPSAPLLNNGFLIPYSRNTLEDDFNDMSYWLFVKPKELNQICNNYPKIREKRDLAIKFYKSIDDKYVFDVKSAARGVTIRATDPSVKKQQKAEAKQKAQMKQKQMKPDSKQKPPAQTNPPNQL